MMDANVKELSIQPLVTPTLDERLIAALERTPAKEYTLDVGADGELIIDKTLHPDLYDWMVNDGDVHVDPMEG